jgi:TetR/AcrR family transcriptional repressor of nem operon
MRTRARGAVEKAPPERKLQALIDVYLSDEHCADPAGGCPMAALLSEAPRYPRSVRTVIDSALQEIAALTAGLMPGNTEEERRQNALVLFSGMAGTLAAARAVADEQLRRTLLKAARKTYLEAFSKQR